MARLLNKMEHYDSDGRLIPDTGKPWFISLIYSGILLAHLKVQKLKQITSTEINANPINVSHSSK